MAKVNNDRIFALVDVAKRKSRIQLAARDRTLTDGTDKSRSSTYVTFKGQVYDITSFLPDHPGGDDIIMEYAGGDIGQIMADESQHVHSRSAYDMLEEYKVGELGGDEKIVSEGESARWYRLIDREKSTDIGYRLGSQGGLPPGRDGCPGRFQPQQVPRSHQASPGPGLEFAVDEGVLPESGAQPTPSARTS